MCSTDEYQHQQYWKETWIEQQQRKYMAKMNKENEEWFSRTHDLIMNNLKKTIECKH